MKTQTHTDDTLPMARSWRSGVRDYIVYPLSFIIAGGILASAVNPGISFGILLVGSPIAVVIYAIYYRWDRMWDRLLRNLND